MPKGVKLGGRKKGTPNKLTGDVKAMVLAALDKAGGADYLYRQSLENPTAFMTLVGKVLPLTLAGDKDNPLGPRAIYFGAYPDQESGSAASTDQTPA